MHYFIICTWIIITFLGTCVTEHIASTQHWGWRPSVLLGSIATHLRSFFYSLGEYVGVVCGFLVLLKDYFIDYLLRFWPSVEAVVVPLFEISMSWVWFLKGLLWQFGVMSTSVMKQVWKATNVEYQVQLMRGKISVVNLSLLIIGIVCLLIGVRFVIVFVINHRVPVTITEQSKTE
jgi:hypothetical protein